MWPALIAAVCQEYAKEVPFLEGGRKSDVAWAFFIWWFNKSLAAQKLLLHVHRQGSRNGQVN